ncbi:hypothetical protein [Natrarchaeobius oligotrophus]|uniref:hypothetical protein n=1 Tax=Natrarchaeobius oligotrophus TaxID=3455743 RepID=UPI000F52A8A9|nr:hypothetical protein [Natrarchaeobius chitinivorans]
MNRRKLLTSSGISAGVISIGTAGYVRYSSDMNITVPSQVSEFSFETENPPVGWYLEGNGIGPEDNPQITHQADTSPEIKISGTLFIGSRNCEKAIVDELTYDDSDSTIRVIVTWANQSMTISERLQGRLCREALASARYTIKMTVEDHIRSIDVIERDYRGNKYSSQESL